ncbi:propionyl-coenzyme A carboxylase alpha polypeptide [Mesorhizobium sp. B1-1-9]|nr:propionyl-coenzyme A carboxylase alpha polypeptide [Mesorhizobium sp. B1-1-9]TPN44201.1 propionyl-coenzyme A carboxylase alpha polypeptide [Mesorhizobium sp. B1-1-7]
MPPSGLPAISPSRGEIGSSHGHADLSTSQGSGRSKLLISPLEGEMSGRTEGGATERDVCEKSHATLRHHHHRR